MGPIHSGSDGAWWLIIVLVLCGIAGVAFAGV